MVGDQSAMEDDVDDQDLCSLGHAAEFKSLSDQIMKNHQVVMDAVGIVNDTASKSYAQAASFAHGNIGEGRRVPLPQQRSQSENVILVAEKSEGNTKMQGQTIKLLLQQSKSVSEGKVRMCSTVKPFSVVLNVQSPTEAEIIKTELSQKGYMVKNASKMLPQLKVTKVDPTMSKDEFVRYLKAMNPLYQSEDVSVVAKSSPAKDRTECTVVLRVPISVASQVPKSGGYVFIRESRLPVFADDPVVQCYNCRRLGHRSAKCREPPRRDAADTLCPNCGLIHAKNQACKTFCCLNCKAENDKNRGSSRAVPLDTSHSSANLKVCPVAKRIRNVLLSKMYS